jgi:Protein of unknown function (DUF1549)
MSNRRPGMEEASPRNILSRLAIGFAIFACLDVFDSAALADTGKQFFESKVLASGLTNHWAFQPIQRTKLPAVKKETWPRGAIDHFILAKLEEKRLTPSPTASKQTLLRRLTFDLIGLPPSPKDLEAFEQDDSPEAIERVVDRLLASRQFGERWGRHWLDVARYADSNGSDENFTYYDAWRFRNYVIEAFYNDKPFDQFVREQIAGDLLPSAEQKQRDEQIIATGFLVLGPKVIG